MMDRKRFLNLMLATTTASIPFHTFGFSPRKQEPLSDIKLPSYLKAGDTIGITSPAGFITLAEIRPAVELIQSWGFKVVIGETIGRRDFTFGGTDQQRAEDLQMMLDNDAVRAIMCARGGYGTVRIIDRLDFSRFRQHPKWIIGFSDITLLHCHLNSRIGIASVHAKMCNSFPSDWFNADPVQIQTILSIRQR